MQNGVMGNGGYPDDFNPESHCLRKLKVANFSGVLFASLDLNAPPFEDYLGPQLGERVKTICHSPMKIWGYQRHTMDCNWKALHGEHPGYLSRAHAACLHSPVRHVQPGQTKKTN